MRLLIVKLSSLGDLFHALPAVHELKRGLEATVDWVVQKEYGTLVRTFDDIERVIEFPRRNFLRKAAGFLRELRRREYDMVVDLQGLLKSALVSRLARGRRRIGPSFCREGSRFLYSEVAGPANEQRHAVERNRDAVRFLGLPVGEARFPVTFPDQAVAEPSPRLGVVPASRWASKNWPPECFVDVIERLRSVREVSVFLFGSEKDGEVCRRIEERVGPGVVNLAGRTTLSEVGGYLQAMDLVLTNDSGPGHMAVAAGTPTLMLFGPTDAVRTGPYGDAHRVISANESCDPCYSHECRERSLCLTGIRTERVSEMVLEMLDA